MMDVPLKRSKDHREPVKNDEHDYSLLNYLRTAHVHGLKFLATDRKFQTLFWILILLTSFAAASYFIIIANDTTTTSLVSLPPQPVHTLPFAAITICPESQAKASMVNFTNSYHYYQSDDASDENLSEDEVEKIEALTQVCDPHLLSNKKLKATPTPGEKFTNILREISLGNGFMLFCKYRGKVSSCADFFTETITDDGICYTFNKLKSDKEEASWSLKTGYNEDTYDSYPHRAFAGSSIGFNVVLYQKFSDLDYMCRGPVQGYKVKIHPPDEHPRMMSGYQRIALNSETLISVNPVVTRNTAKVGDACHSSESKLLNHFKEYSQANCISECLSEYAKSECGCVKFSMIHNNDSRICNQHDTKCISEAMDVFSTEARFKDDFPCDCKPSCDSLSYDIKSTQATFNFQQVFNSYKEDLDEFPEAIMGRLVVYFEKDFYVPTVETCNGSFVNIIAKIGGILAFFLGASLISIIEVFFFIFRRLSR